MPSKALEGLGTFDLIISSPPLGLQQITETFPAKEGPLEVRDSETHILLLRAASHLSEGGEAIFILANNFFLARNSISACEALPMLGLHVNSIIALPPGAFSFLTSIELNLVVISRKKTAEIFVGQLSQDSDPTPLLKNLQKRTKGPAPELGRLIKPQEYAGWHVVVAAEEQQRLADRSGLEAAPLADLIETVNLGKQTDGGDFEDLPNCVYLPLIGTSPAVTTLGDLRIKPHNYAQLVVRPDKTYAEFLAAFFNSPLGRKTRDALLRGTFIPKINKQALLGAAVYTLPLESQKQAVDVGREIQELRLRLEELERQLWNRPVDASKIRKAVNSVNQKDAFEAWLESLPFPVASILLRYDATASVEHKNAHLLNFFEATVQFLGTLMTSAFHSDEQFFHEHKGDWFEAGKDNPHSLAKSSFGEWVVRCKRLAHTTRQLLSAPDTREFCLNLYKTHDTDKIEAITSKSIFAILEKVGYYRNDWKGHPGITSPKEHERRLTLLQEELTRLRGILGSVFEDWWLIRSRPKAYTRGMHSYQTEKLMGSHQVFKQVELETSALMDSNELYFFETATGQPLQAVHFFRMMSSPETEEIACYFLSRVEKEGVRFVSYHYEGKADRIEPDPSVLKLIEEVEENNA